MGYQGTPDELIALFAAVMSITGRVMGGAGTLAGDPAVTTATYQRELAGED